MLPPNSPLFLFFLFWQNSYLSFNRFFNHLSVIRNRTSISTNPSDPPKAKILNKAKASTQMYLPFSLNESEHLGGHYLVPTLTWTSYKKEKVFFFLVENEKVKVEPYWGVEKNQDYFLKCIPILSDVIAIQLIWWRIFFVLLNARYIVRVQWCGRRSDQNPILWNTDLSDAFKDNNKKNAININWLITLHHWEEGKSKGLGPVVHPLYWAPDVECFIHCVPLPRAEFLHLIFFLGLDYNKNKR